MKFYPLKISEIRRESPECVSIAFEVPPSLHQTFHFTQGQYLTLRTELQGQEVRRSYSLCSSPLDQEWRVAVKKVDGGQFSTFANDQLTTGSQLEVSPPDGRFFPESVAPNSVRHYVLMAAGSGITPVMSILKTVLRQSPESRVTLIYGNKRSASIIFREEIEGLKNRYLDRLQVVHVLSRERPDAAWQHGRINQNLLQQMAENLPELLEGDQYFICGPEEMIHCVREELEKKGISKSKIHFELFGTNQSNAHRNNAATSDRVVSHAEIQLDGLRFDLPIHEGEAILDAALAAGADLPFACRGGVCCTCRAKLEEGTVEMDVNYALDESEVEAGFILTCQSHPKTPKLKVNFDIK